MVAAGVDECTDVTEFLYGRLGLIDKGITLGEGSVSLILETEKSAISRNAKKYAELCGWANAHKSVEFGSVGGTESAVEKAVKDACAAAGIKTDDIDLVSGFANGDSENDALQNSVFAKLFAGKTVLGVKDEIGEARAAASAEQAAKLAQTLSENESYKYALAVSVGSGGQVSAVVLKKIG